MGRKLFFFLLLFGFKPMLAQTGNSQLVRLMNKAYRIVEGDTSKKEKKYYLILPIVGVAPETGWKLGVSIGKIFRLNHDGVTRPSLLRLNFQYTERHQFSVMPTIDLFFDRNKWNLKGQFVFNNLNEYYWGIGNLAPDSAKELCNFRQNKLTARLSRQVFPSLYVGVQVQYEKLYQLEFVTESKTPQSGIAGIAGYEIMAPGLAVVYDNRDNIYYPLKGAYLECSDLAYIRALNGLAFHQLTVDLRKYMRLWNNNVLAMQGYGVFNQGDVPYRAMATIGSEHFMRGYYNGRFRDKNMFAVQAEIRKTIWGPVAVTAFLGGGNVGSDGKDLFSQFKINYGAGLRGLLIRKEKINIRADVGFGENGIHGLYLTLGEAF